ncbi:MAG TPA: DUF2892 domain-containing protein [Longimicrobiales bacterium]|nr:DUF2892 domain-containing protein [Longimicrobiales bacterium]
MRVNMGTADRLARFLVGVAIVVLLVTRVIDGAAAVGLGLFAVLLFATSSTGKCPGYVPFGLSTRGKERVPGDGE